LGDTSTDPTIPDPVQSPAAQPPAQAPVTDPAGQDKPPAEPAAVDYKALYEQTQTKLTKAEQLARERKDKAKRLDEIEAAQQTEAERAAARATAAEKQLTTLRRRAVDAEIRAAATGWAAPADAPLYLTDRDRYVGEDGEIDTASITADLGAVLSERPHLARFDGPRRPAPDPAQGARQTGPVGLGAQITDAETRGDWAAAIALKNQRLSELAQKQR
jgi:hypothetical protein